MNTTLFSQQDPEYGSTHLGKSRLTIYGWGCFVVSLANLYQVHPLDILKIPHAINADGLLISKAIANHFGGEALPPQPPTNPPNGWCIAQTDFFASRGYPTHFFCVNPQLGLQIDPLDFPANFEAISYPIVNYRPFTNTVLDHRIPQALPTWQRRLGRLLARLASR